MASSSGMSQNSGSEGDLAHVMDERKRKRMISNRESARRSRMRKQKHLDDLMAQVAELRRENQQIMQTISLTSQQLMNVEADNSVLKAQMGELAQRLQSLNEIVNYMNTLTPPGLAAGIGTSAGIAVANSFDFDLEDWVGNGVAEFGAFEGYNGNFGNNPWNNLGYLNQPIMASADVPQY